MSFLSKLQLDSNEYNILSVDYEISQPVGRRNMPTDQPHLGLINITVESSNRSELLSWAIAPRTTKNGSITFFRRDAQSSMKTLKFFDTFCINYKEKFEADGAVPMQVVMTLAPRRIECQGVMLEELWPGFSGESSDSGDSGSSGNSNSNENQTESKEIGSFIPS